eukprot:gb/GECH01006962.1/.p1 GENE.gb/GECH01006962.1/~~gb/GECH01006962.1/.p1  ORF type:complete len:209 (+),score=52.43 gb/GECH01006962.1/:1-627(+)
MSTDNAWKERIFHEDRALISSFSPAAPSKRYQNRPDLSAAANTLASPSGDGSDRLRGVTARRHRRRPVSVLPGFIDERSPCFQEPSRSLSYKGRVVPASPSSPSSSSRPSSTASSTTASTASSSRKPRRSGSSASSGSSVSNRHRHRNDASYSPRNDELVTARNRISKLEKVLSEEQEHRISVERELKELRGLVRQLSTKSSSNNQHE